MSQTERHLRWLDDRMIQLQQLDSAIKIGRIQGELRQMTLSAGESHTYERTAEYRLQRHYEREYTRLRRTGDTP